MFLVVKKEKSDCTLVSMTYRDEKVGEFIELIENERIHQLKRLGLEIVQ